MLREKTYDIIILSGESKKDILSSSNMIKMHGKKAERKW